MNEQVICPKCQGDGKVWAEGVTRYPTENPYSLELGSVNSCVSHKPPIDSNSPS